MGDALAMPFADDSFDMCYSHAVIEHLPTQPFLLERRRVLRPGGRIAALSVRSRFNLSAESAGAASDEEKALMAKLWATVNMEPDRVHGLGQYDMAESDFPTALETAGFARVDVRAVCLMCYAPDNADTPAALAERQINEGRVGALESARKALRRSPGGLTAGGAETLFGRINARFDERLARYRRGEKLWDMAASFVLIATAEKPTA